MFSINTIAQTKPSMIHDALYALRIGNVEKAEQFSNTLASSQSSESHFKYLDALLTQQGLQASFKYNALANVHKNTVFAEASLYRLYSYYYAIGSYATAEKYKNELKNTYPVSVYNDYVSLESNKIDQLLFPGMKTQTNQTVIKNPKAEEDGNFTLKVGAFIDDKNVANLKTNLESLGYPVTIEKKIVGGTEFTIVLAGSFLTEQDAEQALLIVNKRLGTNGKVITK